MSIFGIYNEHEADEEQKAKRRLLDIVTKELSIVNRAANKKRFIFVKSDDGTIVGTDEQAVTRQPWISNKTRFTIEQLIKAVPKAILEWAKKSAEEKNRDIRKRDLKFPFKEPDGTININGVKKVLRKIDRSKTPIDLPASVKASAKKELEGLLDRISKEDSMKKKKVKKEDLSFGNDPGFEDPTDELLEKASDLIEEVEDKFDLDEVDASPGKNEEIGKFSISEATQGAVVKAATGALERLMNFIDIVKGAPITEDDATEGLPPSLGRSFNRIIRDLEGIASQYPTPVDKQELTEEAKPRIAKKLTESIERLMKVLEAVRDAEITAEKKEFSVSPEVGQMIFDTTKSLDRLAKKYPSVVGRYESPTSDNVQENVQDDTTVEKAGRRFSAKNLEAIKEIQDKLNKLLGETGEENVEETDAATATATKTELSVSFADDVAAGFEKALAPVKETLDKLVDVSKAHSDDISKLKGEHPAPNSRKIEKSHREEESVSWPSDMNRPMDKDSIPAERYMG